MLLLQLIFCYLDIGPINDADFYFERSFLDFNYEAFGAKCFWKHLNLTCSTKGSVRLGHAGPWVEPVSYLGLDFGPIANQIANCSKLGMSMENTLDPTDHLGWFRIKLNGRKSRKERRKIEDRRGERDFKLKVMLGQVHNK